MLHEQFFRPGHVVPAAELVAAAREHADAPEAQVLVEADAIVRQIFIARALRLADAGIEIVDVLSERQLLNRAVEALAETVLARVEGEIDRRLCTVVVGLTRDERVRIGVAEELAIFILRDEIRVFARDIRDAAAEFVERRYVVSNEMAVFSTYGA